MAALRAEWIRARGSTLWWLASAGLLVGLVLTAFSLMGRANDASGLLHPQGVLLTGMAAPIAAIFAGVPNTASATPAPAARCGAPPHL